MIEFVIKTLAGILSFGIVLEYMNIFLEKREVKKLWRSIFYVLTSIVAVLLELGEFPPYVNMVSNCIYMYMMALIRYRGSYQKKFFVTITLFALWMIVETVLGYCFRIVGVNVFQVEILGSVFSKLILLIIVKSVNQFVVHKYADNMSFEYWCFLLFFPVASIMVVLCIFLLCNYCTNEILLIFALISSMVFLPLNIMLFRIFDKLVEQIEVEKKNIVYQQMIDLYSKHTQEEKEEKLQLQVMRHDMKHHLFAIRSMAERQADNDILEYIAQIITAVEFEGKRIAKSGNIVVDSVINRAYMRATKNRIRFKLRLEIPYKMDFQDADLYVLFGNALSNAQEAAEKISDEDERFIDVSVVYRKGHLDIGMRNSFVGQIKKNKQGYLVSSKEDTRYHGMGLYSIEAVVRKYNGFFQTIDEDGIFTLIAVLQEGKIT